MKRMTKAQRAQQIIDLLAKSWDVQTVKVMVTSSMGRNVAGLYHHRVYGAFKATNLQHTTFRWFSSEPRIDVRQQGDIDTLLHEFTHHLVASWELCQPDPHGHLFWQVYDDVYREYRRIPNHVELSDAY